MLACIEQFGRTVLQTDLHLTLQDEHPLGMGADMKSAAKTHGALAPLQTVRWQHRTQAGRFAALVQRNGLFAKASAAIGVGE